MNCCLNQRANTCRGLAGSTRKIAGELLCALNELCSNFSAGIWLLLMSRAQRQCHLLQMPLSVFEDVSSSTVRSRCRIFYKESVPAPLILPVCSLMTSYIVSFLQVHDHFTVLSHSNNDIRFLWLSEESNNAHIYDILVENDPTGTKTKTRQLTNGDWTVDIDKKVCSLHIERFFNDTL